MLSGPLVDPWIKPPSCCSWRNDQHYNKTQGGITCYFLNYPIGQLQLFILCSLCRKYLSDCHRGNPCVSVPSSSPFRKFRKCRHCGSARMPSLTNLNWKNSPIADIVEVRLASAVDSRGPEQIRLTCQHLGAEIWLEKNRINPAFIYLCWKQWCWQKELGKRE